MLSKLSGRKLWLQSTVYWLGDFREAAEESFQLRCQESLWSGFFLWLVLLILEHCQKWTYTCSVEMMPNEITAIRELALQWADSSGLSLYLKEWNGMLTRFLFIYFNLYLPSGAHLCLFSSLRTFSRRWADNEWLFGCWGSSLCANTEEPLLSSREMFNMFLFQNKVCVSHSQCLSTTKWKQTHERWDSSHPWVLLLLPFWHSWQSPSVAPPSKLFIPHRPRKLCFQSG